jgi:spore germination protein GerM
VLASVLRQLIIGPTKTESFAGYTSALPKTLVILSASFRSGVGYVDLASTLTKLPRSQEVLAVGQLVLTAKDVGVTLGIQLPAIAQWPRIELRDAAGLSATLEHLGDC